MSHHPWKKLLSPQSHKNCSIIYFSSPTSSSSSSSPQSRCLNKKRYKRIWLWLKGIPLSFYVMCGFSGPTNEMWVWDWNSNRVPNKWKWLTIPPKGTTGFREREKNIVDNKNVKIWMTPKKSLLSRNSKRATTALPKTINNITYCTLNADVGTNKAIWGSPNKLGEKH